MSEFTPVPDPTKKFQTGGNVPGTEHLKQRLCCVTEVGGGKI